MSKIMKEQKIANLNSVREILRGAHSSKQLKATVELPQQLSSLSQLQLSTTDAILCSNAATGYV